MVVHPVRPPTPDLLQGSGVAISVERLDHPSSSFVCLLNIIDGHVNLALGPETYNGADRIGDAAYDKNK